MKLSELKRKKINTTKDLVNELSKDGPLFNPKIKYPLKDLLNDLAAIPDYLKDNVYDIPKVLNIKDGKKNYCFMMNTSANWYRINQFYKDKYKDIHIALTRFLKMWNITDFIKKHEELLMKKGLIITESINKNFLKYLLDYQLVNIKNLPKILIQDFIKKQNQISPF